MREVTVYYADDGTMFDDEEKCYDYEEECHWKNLMDDYNIELHNNLGGIPQNFNETYYINFRDEQAVEGFNKYAREHEIYYSVSEISKTIDYAFCVGHWIFDSSNDEWVSLEALEAYTKRIKGKMGW